VTTAVGKQERTYAILRERILDGTYGPGQRLVIDALARDLDVSPMPVREAIRRLEAEGWVTYQRHQGAQVAPLDEAGWMEALSTLAVLEGYATALAAPHLGAADLSRARACNEEMGDALGALDVMAVSNHNLAFHRALTARCPNGYLRRQLATTQERLNTMRSSIFMFVPTRGRVSVDEHEELVTMIERGVKPSKIERFARAHKLQTVEAVRVRLGQDAA
jgi:DNA-binding GntR family transcriptional regulator